MVKILPVFYGLKKPVLVADKNLINNEHFKDIMTLKPTPPKNWTLKKEKQYQSEINSHGGISRLYFDCLKIVYGRDVERYNRWSEEDWQYIAGRIDILWQRKIKEQERNEGRFASNF